MTSAFAALMPAPVTGALTAAAGAAATAAGAAATATGVARTMPGQARAAVAVAADVGQRRRRRRVWSHRGRAHIEVRGLTGRGAAHQRLARAVSSALTSLKGVDWAEVNAVTAQVLVIFDEDEVDIAGLVAAVESAERDHGTAASTFAWSMPPHPADDAPVFSAAAALAADAAGMALAAAGRFGRLTPLPPAIRAPFQAIEAQPRLRQAALGRFGPPGGNLLLAAGSSLANGLSQGSIPLALDAALHLIQLGELRSRRAVWARQELALHSTGHALPPERAASASRPAPPPAGPVEKAATRTSLASLTGAGAVLAWTRNPGQAADTILATAPKAARLGRESFAGVLGMELARRDVVPLDGSSLRRLDRVSAVLIDSEALCAGLPRILFAGGDAGPAEGAAAWQAAEHVLAGLSVTDLAGSGPWTRDGWRLARAAGVPGRARVGGQLSGPDGLALDLFDEHGRHHGVFVAGCDLDLRTEALLGVAREGAGYVVLTEHASTAELAAWADEVLPARRSLAGEVRRLQACGHTVLVIAAGRHRALAGADVGVGVVTGPHGVSWSADLVCGPGLAEAWRVLRAVGAAHRASERAARLSIGGSALGALLVATGQGPQRTRLGVAPVQSAAVVAMVAGAAGARSVGREPEPVAVPRGAWHAMTGQAALARLRAGATRSRAQPGRHAGDAGGQATPVARVAGAAQATLAAAGRNRLVAATIVGPARGLAELSTAVREELADPLTPVLALGTAASAVVGSSVDAMLVAGVMAGNALISGGQRMRAERSLGRLLAREQPTGRRVDWQPRARPPGFTGEEFTGLARAPQDKVPASDLVPGDIIALRPSAVVPADGRLLAASGLEVDESTLTGESLPVAKSADPAPGAPLAERACMVYEGTTVAAGHGFAVVTATGTATEAGRAALAAGPAAPATGIQARLAELTRVAVPASGLGGLAVAGLGLARGVPLREAIASGVAVAVAAVPEGLPLVATVAQLAAARRLTGTGVLVRSSRALEALGRVDVICFDKTGTLTEGRLTVTRLAGPGHTISFGSPQARHLLRVAARACPPADADGTRKLAHATDRAVVESAIERLGADRSWHLSEELPFEASRGYAASLGHNSHRTQLAVKGAPEVVLPRCTRVTVDPGRAGQGTPSAPMTPARRRAAQAVLQDLAAQGLRVLAVAEADLPRPPEAYHLTRNGHGNGQAPGRPARTRPANGRPANGRAGDGHDDLVGELTLTGFVAIADTPRASAKATIRRLTEAGVRITMITGDHPATAVAVARKIGIPHAGRVLTGAEISRLPEAVRAQRISAAVVFARVSPEQKVSIVHALQRSGQVVAMVGDGINDAAAIRLADVGIGVTSKGSVSARTAADLVLTGTGTMPILDALVEGRALWARVRDAVSILVGGNAGEVAFTLLGTIVTGRAPLSTRQLLLVNTLTDMLPALAVALGPARPGLARESQLINAGPVGTFMAPELARALAIRGGATALGATVAWQTGRMTGRRQRASTMGLATLVLTQLGQTLLTSGRSPLTVATSAVSAAVLAGIVETPGVSQFFGCTPLGPVAWTIVAGSAGGATLAAAIAPRLLPVPSDGTHPR